MYMANKRKSTFKEIAENFGEKIENFGLRFIVENCEKVGYFVVYVRNEEKSEILEIGILQRFPESFAFQVSKEICLGLKVKYEEDWGVLVDEVEKRNKAKAEKGKKKRERKRQKEEEMRKKRQLENEGKE